MTLHQPVFIVTAWSHSPDKSTFVVWVKLRKYVLPTSMVSSLFGTYCFSIICMQYNFDLCTQVHIQHLAKSVSWFSPSRYPRKSLSIPPHDNVKTDWTILHLHKGLYSFTWARPLHVHTPACNAGSHTTLVCMFKTRRPASTLTWKWTHGPLTFLK